MPPGYRLHVQLSSSMISSLVEFIDEKTMSIDIGHMHTVEVGYVEFCGAFAAHDLKPLWKIAKQLMPEAPLPTTQAWLWK